MKKFFSKKSNIGFTVFAAIILFAFSGQHPTTSTGGYTGAPGDGACTQCHTPGGSLDGTIEISGLPATVMPNDTYPLTVTITNTSGTAAKAGFQMVSLKANLANGGTFIVPATETNALVKTIGSNNRSYIGHLPAKDFAGSVVTYMAEWTAPASATGNITLYAASIIANGANGNSQDKFVATSITTSLASSGDPLTATFTSDTPTSCSDTNDGTATIQPSGGSGNYSYNWDNGETTKTATMLSAGDHNVTVTDDSNESIVASITIESPDPISLTIISQSDADCNGATSGMAEVLATGGNGGYMYDWGSGITGPIQNNLAAGSYTITVSDINNCQTTTVVNIDQPEQIIINITNLTMPDCNGDSNGNITVEATGGNGGFAYTWLSTLGTASGGTLSDIPTGSYTVEVFDTEGCNNSISVTLGEPDELTINISSTPTNCLGGSDGSATATSDGGTGIVEYSWSNGGSGAIQTNLEAGEYEVTATDANNCTTSGSVTVDAPSSAVTAGIVVTTQPNCGNEDGTLSAFGDGGSPDYTYLWSDGSTNAVLTNIAAGEYTITVTDSNGCTASAEATLTENESIQLAANDVINNDCFGGSNGSATISANGGVGTYVFLWSNGGTNPTENELAAGEYTITVTDVGGCTGEITIEIIEPLAFEANEIITDISCDGADDGSIIIAPTGGTGQLTNLWNIGNTEDTITGLVPGAYAVTITDELGCMGDIFFAIEEPDAIEIEIVNSIIPNCPGDSTGAIEIITTGGTGMLSYLWSTGDTTTSISMLEEGDYTLSISDENGCMEIQSFTLDDPLEIEAISTQTLPSCFGDNNGSITISASGGSAPYTYLWENGDTTATINSIEAGEYSVVITDDKSCTKTLFFTLDSPLEINPNVTSMDVSQNGANDGSAEANPQDGIQPYSFLWSNGATSPSITDLSPGIYSVTITDAMGCEVIASITINNGDCNITSMADITDISCFDEMDGIISLTLSGAVDPITYQWSNGDSTAIADSLDVGLYSVTATDANGCLIQVVDLEITGPQLLVVNNITITDATTSETQDGSITFDIEGGTGEIDIAYTDANGVLIGLENFDSLGTGSYGLLLTDENGCSDFFGPFVVGVISSTSDIEFEASVYPNPSSQFINLDIKNHQLLTSLPKTYDLNGRIVDVIMSRTNDGYRMDVSKLVNGIYYIKLSSGKNNQLIKVLVAKN